MTDKRIEQILQGSSCALIVDCKHNHSPIFPECFKCLAQQINALYTPQSASPNMRERIAEWGYNLHPYYKDVKSQQPVLWGELNEDSKERFIKNTDTLIKEVIEPEIRAAVEVERKKIGDFLWQQYNQPNSNGYDVKIPTSFIQQLQQGFNPLQGEAIKSEGE